MSSLFRLFEKFAINRSIIDESFLVGGTVRDILSGKAIHDYDIVIKRHAVDIAKKFADEVAASFVVLDGDFGIIRIAKDREFIDICAMKGESIEDDLSCRDFTINAMALNMNIFKKLVDSEGNLTPHHIIDPFNGMNDLSLKIIRMVSEDNLKRDPLRLLRAYRFASTLDFSIHPDTCNAICKLSLSISDVSVERIAEELRHILCVQFSFKTFNYMLNSGLLTGIFTELQNISHEILYYAIQSCSCAENILANISLYFPGHEEFINVYFKEVYRINCLKLALLLGDGNLSVKAAIRLKMSNREIEFIRMVTEEYNKLISLKRADRHQKIDYLIDLCDNIYPLLIFSIAREMIFEPAGQPTLLFCNEMLEIYHNEIVPKRKLLPLLTGDDLIQEFHLKPSPLFSKVLREIERLFFHGHVKSRDQAFNVLREMLKLQQDKKKI